MAAATARAVGCGNALVITTVRRFPRDETPRQTEVQTWVAQLLLSASSVAHAHTVLAGILDDALGDRRLATNPARGVKLPRKTDRPRNYLTAAQVSSLAEPVSGRWSLSRAGTELRNDPYCDSPELTSVDTECAQYVPTPTHD